MGISLFSLHPSVDYVLLFLPPLEPSLSWDKFSFPTFEARSSAFLRNSGLSTQASLSWTLVNQSFKAVSTSWFFPHQFPLVFGFSFNVHFFLMFSRFFKSLHKSAWETFNWTAAFLWLICGTLLHCCKISAFSLRVRLVLFPLHFQKFEQ